MPLEAFDACRDMFRVGADTGACHVYLLAKDWQSLIAGTFAIIGAIVTIIAVNRQIRSSIEAERRGIDRESVAARAVLPLTLSEIVGHGNEVIKALAGMHASTDPIVRKRGAKYLPVNLKFSIEPIRDTIKFSEQPYTGKLSALAAWLQVYEVRLDGLRTFNWDAANIVVSNDAIELMMADAAQLIARAEDLFQYGRLPAAAAKSFDVDKARWALERNGVIHGMISGDSDPHERVQREALMGNQTTDRVGVRKP